MKKTRTMQRTPKPRESSGNGGEAAIAPSRPSGRSGRARRGRRTRTRWAVGIASPADCTDSSSCRLQSRAAKRAIRNAHAERVQRYYHAGSSYGMSVVESCYLLASEMNRGDNDLLWWVLLLTGYRHK